MKLPAILLALIPATMLFSGCSKEEKVETLEPVRVITSDKTEEREGIRYEVNQTTPFTGLVEDFYSSGQVKLKVNYKGGKKHGVETKWYENAKKESELNYKDGKEHGLHVLWYKSGSNMAEVNYKEGRVNGLYTRWRKNGTKKLEQNFKDGQLDGVETTWDENGKKLE